MKMIPRLSIVAVLFFLMSVLLNSCMKENGKKQYLLRLEFSSGDVWEKATIVHEKTENIFDKNSHKYIKNKVYLDFKYIFYLIKVENRFLTGVNNIEIDATNFNMLNGQSGEIQGRIEMDGAYKRHFREYIVEDGTFKFLFVGSPFNLSDTIYSGKWTLKRK